MATQLLLVFSLLLPSGLTEKVELSAAQGKQFVGAVEHEASSGPIDIEVEELEVELFTHGALSVEMSLTFESCMVYCSHVQGSSAALDSTGCRPPPTVA